MIHSLFQTAQFRSLYLQRIGEFKRFPQNQVRLVHLDFIDFMGLFDFCGFIVEGWAINLLEFVEKGSKPSEVNHAS